MNTNDDLTGFLINNKSKNNSPTHTRIPDRDLNIYGGSYYIPSESVDDFYKRYYHKVFVQKQSEYLTEKQLDTDQACIAVDVDLRYPVNITSRQHSGEHNFDMLALYLEELRSFVKFESNVTFPVYIMEKPHVNIVEEKGVTKDGVHMIIGIQLNHTLQLKLRERILKKLPDIWSDIPINNTWDSVLDEGISTGKTNWQLYGSRKPGHEAYSVTQYFMVSFDSADSEFMIAKKDIKSIKLDKELHKISVRYTEFPKFELTDVMREEFLRISANGVQNSRSKNRAPPIRLDESNDYTDVPLNAIRDRQTLEAIIEKKLDSLPKDRYHVRETHEYAQILPAKYYEPGSHLLNRKVAFGLKDTHDCLFYSWILLRSKASDFDFETIPSLFNSWKRHFKNGNGADRITRKSIMYWARLDADPDDYNKIRESNVDKYVEQTITAPSDFDFAQVLYNLFKERYLCNGVGSKASWFVYCNHKWKKDEGETLRLKISQEMYGIYQRKIDQYTEELRIATEDQDQEKIETCKKKMLHVSQVQIKLKRTSDKNNIIREAQALFYDENFRTSVNNDKLLLGFNNGVVDFRQKCFRDGCPSDYITLSTGIDFREFDPSEDKDISDAILTFMEKLFPDPEINRYMWDHLASILVGTNLNQTFNFYLGVGSNGKSVLTTLIEKMLGEYSKIVPLAAVTDKRPGMGGLSPEMADLKGARFGLLMEPSKDMVLNEGQMKQVTGGDRVQARGLYCDTESFSLQITLVVMCNVLFDIKSNDEGTWRRIRVVDFVSKFVDNQSDVNEENNKYLKDPSLGDKLDDWAPVLAGMLVKRCFETNGRVVDCEPVLAASRKYRQGQDHIEAFVQEKVVKTDNPRDRIGKRELTNEFKTWFQENEGGGKPPKGKELYEYMDKIYGKAKTTGWHGLEIVYADQEDDIDEIGKELN